MGAPRVVLADDNKALLDSVRELLAEEFDVVATAGDGQAAFEAARALRPEAVVLDISMPIAGGLEVARWLSALPDPPQIVILSVHEAGSFWTRRGRRRIGLCLQTERVHRPDPRPPGIARGRPRLPDPPASRNPFD